MCEAPWDDIEGSEREGWVNVWTEGTSRAERVETKEVLTEAGIGSIEQRMLNAEYVRVLIERASR
jgi:hypothetical protein